MPHINLLPWREELRRQRQRQFINITVGAVVMMLGILVLVHLRIAGIIENQNLRNQFLDMQIEQVNKEIKEIETLEKEKTALLARMKIIQELQGSRPEIVHLFDEIANAIPEQIFLLKLSRNETSVSIEGVADSNDYISELMRRLNSSPRLSNPKLEVIESGKKAYPDSSWFKLTVTQISITPLEADK